MLGIVIPALGNQRDCRIPVVPWSNTLVCIVSYRSIRNLTSFIKKFKKSTHASMYTSAPFRSPSRTVVCSQSTCKTICSEFNYSFLYQQVKSGSEEQHICVSTISILSSDSMDAKNEPTYKQMNKEMCTHTKHISSLNKSLEKHSGSFLEIFHLLS